MFTSKLVLEDKTFTSIYNKLLKKNNFIITNEIILDNNNYKIDDDLIIIDLRSSKSFKKLQNIILKDNSFILIISPILKEFIKLPNSFNYTNVFYITKPINIPKLENILLECKEKIKKNKYLKTKENILIKTIDDSPLRIAIYNLDGNMLYANLPYILLHDIKNEDNAKFEDLKSCQIEFKDIIYNLKSKHIYSVEKKEGEKWFKSFFYITEDEDNIVHLCIDETEEKIYIESLKKSAQFFEQSNEGVIITDHKGFILTTNDSFCHITGYTKDEAIGKSTRILNSGTHDKSFYENMWNSLEHYGKWQGEVWNKRKNGEIYPEWLSITKLIDSNTHEINYMAIFTDLTSLKESDAKLRFYANHDHLTGLLNKVQFENMLDQTIKSAVRNNKKFALLFIDLDHFKEVNDTSGHDIGDLVLQEVASRFKRILRKEDVICRIGGDEFTVIIDNIKMESDVLLLSKKLNDEIKKPFKITNKTFYLSLSIGISLFPFHGLSGSELSKNADSAMYEVKKNGRDGILLYNKKFTESLMEKVSLHNDLKEAFKKKEFELYYQLVVAMENQKIVGAEALIRWKHHKRGFVSPEKFIPIAEHHGLIEQIGKFVLKNVCEDLPLLLNKFGKDFVLAINVSSKEFANDNYVEELIEIINDFQISPKNLELEITETYIMQNYSLAIEKMKQLRQKGFNIAIDDFGTGYSSLSYLKKFPINKLKIDKSFVLDILENQDDQDMVKAIINIAKIFHLEVQAEGVETIEHLEILKKHGADIAQGYFYTKPIPIDEICSKDWN